MKKPLININIPVLCVGIIFIISSCTTSESHSVFDKSDNVTIETVYQINPNNLSLETSFGTSDPQDIQAWNTATSLLPNDILKAHITEYHAFTDGLDNNLAYIENSHLDPDTWFFAIDYEDATSVNIANFIETLIHEFSHIVSLSVSQVDRDFSTCKHYQIAEGCSKEHSYLNQFYQQFWNDDLHNQHLASLKGLQEINQDKILTSFYDKHYQSFVTEYATTNAVEDFADTFIFFVLSDKINNPTTVKDHKINFFYQYPKLVDIRQHIRSRTNLRK